MRLMRNALTVCAAGMALLFFAPISYAFFSSVDITLDKTISTNGTCPGSNPVDVAAGTIVTYCYKVTNNTNNTMPVTYTTHTLTDDVLGNLIPPGSPSPGSILVPGGMLTFTATTPISQTTTNTAMWTAGNGVMTTTAQDLATAYVCGNGIIEPGEQCDKGAKNGLTTACCDTSCQNVGGGDTDGDGICNNSDTTANKALGPGTADPQGYLYDEQTGAIIPGGFVGVSCVDTCSGTTVTVSKNGNSGAYAFVLNFPSSTCPAETCQLNATAPAGCRFSTACLPTAGPLVVGTTNPTVIGSGLSGSMLSNFTCAANPFYLSLTLDPNSGVAINNNFPLTCTSVPNVAPAMSPWGLVAASLALVAVGLYTLRRRQSWMR